MTEGLLFAVCRLFLCSLATTTTLCSTRPCASLMYVIWSLARHLE